jgi:hypothetical protein
MTIIWLTPVYRVPWMTAYRPAFLAAECLKVADTGKPPYGGHH